MRNREIYRIQSPKSEDVTNCAYGDPDRKTLYIVDSEGDFIYAAWVPTGGTGDAFHIFDILMSLPR